MDEQRHASRLSMAAATLPCWLAFAVLAHAQYIPPNNQGYPQQQYPQQQYPQQQYPQQAAPAPTTAAPAAAGTAGGTMATPGPLALPCQNDAACGFARCNVQYQKCAFPCAGPVDCAPGNSCNTATGLCLPGGAPQ